ncbi:hypothetical protein GOP47_0016717 [Adiantum capillus-veneris]|uniref:Pentatricopeptide repeat-containing protein n=1 Tax=Adiantum capillus-veneris TaxID=13818 RepID=A0A9D4UIK8_ADICA|nr:hypothetical protein GOP47_0016717 [Adiantum capillus-veneris]
MKLGVTTRLGCPSFWSCNFQCNLLHVKSLSVVATPTYLLEEVHFTLVHADLESYASLLRECTSSKSLPFGQLLHDHIVKAGLEGNGYLCNLIVDMYGRFDGSLPTAFWLFSKMSHPDFFSWNFIIRAYQHSGLNIEALGLFQQMLGQGAVLPDQHIYVSLLSVSANINSIEHGKQLHVHIIWNEFEPEFIVATSLINMYVRCGSICDAWSVFDRMPSRDVIAWSTLIAACLQNDCGKLAVQLLKQLLEEGLLPNKDIIVALLDACGINRLLAEGKQIHACIAGCVLRLDSMIQASLSNMYMLCTNNSNQHAFTPLSGEHDYLLSIADQSKGWPMTVDLSTSPNQFLGETRAALDGSLQGALKKFSQEGLIYDALQTLEQMKFQRVLPDRYSLATLLSACASQSAVLEGEQVYAFICENHVEIDGYLGTALINLFGKSGKLEVAIALFDRILIHDVVSWTAMINAYVQNGESNEAILLYRQMKLRGTLPNEMTFASIVDACNLNYSLTEGQQLHQETIACKMDQNLIVGTALVNLYARFGYLEDATVVFDKMPCRDVIAWNALIAAAVHSEDSTRIFQHGRQMQEEGVLPSKMQEFYLGSSTCTGSMAA